MLFNCNNEDTYKIGLQIIPIIGFLLISKPIEIAISGRE